MFSVEKVKDSEWLTVTIGESLAELDSPDTVFQIDSLCFYLGDASLQVYQEGGQSLFRVRIGHTTFLIPPDAKIYIECNHFPIIFYICEDRKFDPTNF